MGTAVGQMVRAFVRVFVLDPVFLVGLIGLVLWAVQRKGLAIGLFFLCMLPLVLRRQGADPEPPHNLPAYGFALYLGFGAVVAEIAGWVRGAVRWRRVAAFAACAVPVAILIVPAFYWVFTSIPTGAKALGSVRKMEDARAVAVWIEDRCGATDVVVVPERLTPAVRCRAVTWPQVLVAEGISARWYSFVSKKDLVFQPEMGQVGLVVVDAWDRINGVRPEDPACRHPFVELMRGYEWESFASGEYSIFVKEVERERRGLGEENPG
jgi:hypothetical protein